LTRKDVSVPRFVLPTHAPVYRLAMSPDGHHLVAGFADNTAQVWNMDSPSVTPMLLEGHQGPVGTVEISGDNRWVVTGSWDGTARLWNLHGNPTTQYYEFADQVKDARGKPNAILRALVTTDSRWLVTYGDVSSRLWSLSSLPQISSTSLGPPAWWSSGVIISNDSRSLAVCGDKLRLWDLTRSLSTQPLTLDEKRIRICVFSPRSRWLIASEGNIIRVWDLKNKLGVRVLRGFQKSVDQLSVSGNDRWLLSSGQDVPRL